MGSTHGGQLLVVIRQAFFHGEKLVVQVPEELRAQRGQLRLFMLQLFNEQYTKWGDALRQDDAILIEEPTNLIDQRGTGFDEPLPDPMQGLEGPAAPPA